MSTLRGLARLKSRLLCKRRDAASISEEDAQKFRRLCLVSEDACYYAYHSDVGLIDDWWLRDQYFRAVNLSSFAKAGTLDALLKEKHDNLARWDEIVRLASEIHFPDAADGHFVRVSSEYRRFKHRIAEIVIRVQAFLAQGEAASRRLEEKRRDAASPCETAAALVDEFERTWAEWEKLRRDNPDCPTLYEYESFAPNYSEPLSANRSRSCARLQKERERNNYGTHGCGGRMRVPTAFARRHRRTGGTEEISAPPVLLASPG